MSLFGPHFMHATESARRGSEVVTGGFLLLVIVGTLYY